MKNPDNPEDQLRIGVYVCHCGLNIAQTVDCQKVAESVSENDGVIITSDIGYACSEPGQQQIKDDIGKAFFHSISPGRGLFKAFFLREGESGHVQCSSRPASPFPAFFQNENPKVQQSAKEHRRH